MKNEDDNLDLDKAFEVIFGKELEPKYKLVRERDQLTKTSVRVKWLEFDEDGRYKADFEDIAVGRSLLMSPFGPSFTWQTTPVTEIVEQREDYIRFATKNSVYELYEKQLQLMKTTYKNRYGDIFTFELQEDGNILWTGNFEYCRFGMPNDYTRAYNQYVHDNKHVKSLMSLNQFKDAVHEYDDETHQYIYDKYIRMVDCLRDKIDMVDASGGPYITVGMNMKNFGFENSIVKDFEVHKDGYLIITEKL